MMLGRLNMSMNQAITSFNRLMSEVFSNRNAITTGGAEAFKAKTLERGLKRIVREATGDKNKTLLDSNAEVTRCKV
jgi:hypothetical protein